jgi:hypothetical protein
LLATALVAILRMGLFGNKATASELDVPWPVTPYDPVNLDDTSSTSKDFDLFISYKSEDVQVVRQIVNHLIAAGVRPWFAEYVILLIERRRFQEAIDAGIRRSKHGVIFTNDRYVGSEYCRRELDLMLAAGGPGAANLVDVRIPAEPATRQYRPDLATCSTIDYGGQPEQVANALCRRFGFGRETSRPPSRPPKRRHFAHASGAFILDVAGWKADARNPVARSGGWAFRRRLQNHEIRFNLQAGPGVVASRPLTGTLDEREVFNRNIDFANAYMSYHDVRCTGVHLFFHRGFSHLALTYWRTPCWTARYSIVLPDPKTGETLEFAFAFGLLGPFRDYCRAVPLFERVVSSLELIGKGEARLC